MKKIILIFIFLLIPLWAWGALININTADLAELDKIPEVGPAIAGRIITYRTSNGLFKTIEEIKNVSGIGDATFLKMKDFITVGSVDTSAEPENVSDTTTSTNVEDNPKSDSSVHASEKDLSDYQGEAFKIGIGRERLATVRTPIMFSATQNKKGKQANFLWSFGDGLSASGVKVSHVYQFPGRYNVVANASFDQTEEAVARTTVLVSEAKIKITAIDPDAGFVEITNNSDKEQNLNNWSLRTSDKKYSFPTDTIVSPKTSIKIPLFVLDSDRQEMKEVLLAYPDGGIVSGAHLQEGLDLVKLTNLKKQLAKIKREIATNAEGDIAQEIKTVGLTENKKSVITTTSPKNVVVLAKEPNWFEKIKHAIFE